MNLQDWDDAMEHRFHSLIPVSGTGTGFDSSPLMETFAKLRWTAIICSDSQSAKLDFPVDSRLWGNDGRFCKGLHQGRGGLVGCFVVSPAAAPLDCRSSPQ